MENGVSVEYVLSRDEKFRYQLLSRLQSDCEFYLGNGQRLDKHLWASTKEDQIKYMKAIWNSFPEGSKPEWLSHEDILSYERRMNNS